MKKISRWAKANRKKAILLVIIGNVLLLLSALWLGVLSYFADVFIPTWIFYTLVNIFFTSIFLYPIKGHKKGLFKHSYIRQKSCDFVLLMSTVFTLAIAVNYFATTPEPNLATAEGKAQFIVYTPHQQAEQSQKSIFKTWKKGMKTKLKAWKKAFNSKPAKGEVVALQILLFLLTLIATFFLGYGLLLLSCSISCSGYEALAVIVLITGALGLLWLAFITIKTIFQKIGKNKLPPEVAT